MGVWGSEANDHRPPLFSQFLMMQPRAKCITLYPVRDVSPCAAARSRLPSARNRNQIGLVLL